MNTLRAAIGIMLLFAACPLWAQDALTGNWGGLRSAAAEHGYTWQGGFKADAFHNNGASGNGSSLVSNLDIRLDADLEKVMGWAGTSLVLDVLSDSGHGPTEKYVQNLMGVTNIEVAAPTTTRLFQAYLQKSLLNDRFSILAGLYPIDSEFFAMDSAGVFIGPEYGAPADLALTRGPSIFNTSSAGLRARWNVAKTVYAMGAILDGVPDDPAHPKRTAIRFNKGDGIFRIAEIGWMPEAGNAAFNGYAKFALGAWGYSEKNADLADPTQSHHQQGGYVLAEHTLWRFDPDRYISGFVRFTTADGHSTAIKNSVNIGLNVQGPCRSRPDDVLGVAFTRAGISSEWRIANNPAKTTASEDQWELTYLFAVNPYMSIQPDIQIIRNPGGMVGVPDARLVGVRLDLVL